MKFEEIKINEIYEVYGVSHQVVHKHEESRVVFTLEVGSDEPYGFDEGQFWLFSPIALPETGLLISKSGSIVYRTGERSGYGFASPGFISHKRWYCDDGWVKFIPEIWRKATTEDEEKFKKLLIKEAAKRGLVDGVEFNSPAGFGLESIIDTNLIGIGSNGFTMGPRYVFYNGNGKWATPKKEPFDMQEVHNKIKDLQEIAEREGLKITVITETK